MYLILFDTNKTNKNIDMEEKEKTVNMSSVDLNLDAYYDEEEQENVRSIQYEWDYIDKYFFQSHWKNMKMRNSKHSLKTGGSFYVI